MRERICITGLSGRLGSIVAADLAADFDLVALNRRPVAGVESVRADITDGAAVRRGLAGCALVIHLAAHPYSDDDWERILPANLIGAYTVIEAARAAGLRRFVFASSLAAVGGHLPQFLECSAAGELATAAAKRNFFAGRADPHPDSLYGASKVFGESLCRLYALRHGMGCVALRLAEVRPDDRPRPEDPHGPAKMCSHADFTAGLRRALELSRRPGYRVLTLISDDQPG